MPAALSYPGVYVQEISSGVRTIVGVGTSIALFIGRARKGELYKPVQCLSIQDFERAFTSQYADSDLARAVRLFFQNGGTQCYVSRIADEKAKPSTVKAAEVRLLTEAKTPSLDLRSRSTGAFGNDLRVAVSYATLDPESTFNVEVFRWSRTSAGTMVKSDAELFLGLSMNPKSPRYAADVIEQQSKLLHATDVSGAGSAIGFAQSGRPIAARTLGILRSEVMAILTKTATRTSFPFRVSVDGGAMQAIDLGQLDFSVAPLNSNTNFDTNLGLEIAKLINAQVSPAVVTVTLEKGPQGQTLANNDKTKLLRISSIGGDVKLAPGADPATDISGALMLGVAQGGVEVSKWAANRPAPNGLIFQPDFTTGGNSIDFAELPQTGGTALTNIVVAGSNPILSGAMLNTTPAVVVAPDTPIANPVYFQDRNSVTPVAAPDPVSDGVREKWGIIAAAIQAERSSNPSFGWTAEVWGSRLAILPVDGGDNVSGVVVTGGTNIGADFSANVRYYSLGTTGSGAFQTAGVLGNDGGAPSAADYEQAYLEAEREIDLFNLLILPKDAGHSDATSRMLWGPASVFCERRRAFLLIDPPGDWLDSQAAVSPTVGVNTLRVGLVKDHSAVFYPRLRINEDGRDQFVGPAGAIAGLAARIDSARGVWKAFAGTEADLRGVTGIERRFTDGENGVMNPKGVNTIRVFPNGIVSWGARTMDGDDGFGSEYKYIPIRRLALYIEESLYRGLKWVVFEPNDEPLWAQIRLNVGAFMNNLFRQGAFEGKMPSDAYFVKCDASTTTANDRNLGIVNILVGFAPLKPAEFVVLTLQQMAGKIQI